MAMPVTPVTALSTGCSLRFIWVRAFGMDWLGGLAYVTSSARGRR